jgi:hypothetical protein
MVIFIRPQGNKKDAWHEGRLTGKGFGLLSIVFGILGLGETVRKIGMGNH